MVFGWEQVVGQQSFKERKRMNPRYGTSSSTSSLDVDSSSTSPPSCSCGEGDVGGGRRQIWELYMFHEYFLGCPRCLPVDEGIEKESERAKERRYELVGRVASPSSRISG